MSNNKIAIAMKTKYFQIKKLSIYSILGMIALLATSCGSYQSTSASDRDGIYGSNDQRASQTEPTTRKDYFGAYRIENNDTFTDVENYSTSYADTPSQVVVEQSGNYGGWGDNTEGVTVNVYGGGWPYWGWNNYWYGSYWGWNSWIGPSWGIGWGYPYYGYYGWGYPYYGWGWNNCYWGGWNHNHYSNHSYVYNNGRRNYQYNGARGRSYSTSTGTRSYTGTRNNSYTTTGTRNYTPRSTTGTRSETTAPRQYNNNNNTYSAPRSSTPTRSYTPSSSGTRSSGGGGYSGGGGGYSGGGSRGGGRR
jgi:hypothetical protein